MKRLLALIFVWALGASLAFAQTPVQTQPYNSNIVNNASSTIAVTNTFQSIFAASTTTTGRVGCTIQNNDTNTMWVYFGAIAGATKAKSVVLAPGASVQCAAGVISLRDQVSITGTLGGVFYAGLQ